MSHPFRGAVARLAGHADAVDDADNAGHLADVRLGALPLIRQIDLAGHRHPAVFDPNRDAVARDREIPVQSVQDAELYVIAMRLHVQLPPARLLLSRPAAY